ncbi:two-component regulator propeller domain-containing protein [Shivajiella indica]|uniref:histidine kinase n=1 Tax=Shivajiella indica TaxID=872115 RepID=A0ABW5B7E0_9BACT
MKEKKSRSRKKILNLLFWISAFLINQKGWSQELEPIVISVSDGLASTTVQNIFQDRYGLLWISTVNGLQVYDGVKFQTFKNVPGNPNSLIHNDVRNVLEDGTGDIWIATNGGISKFDRKTRQFQNYRIGDQLNRSVIGEEFSELLLDSEQTLWATSFSMGIVRFNPEKDKWEPVPMASGDPIIVGALALAEDKNGGIWSGANSQGLIYKPKGENAFCSIPKNLLGEMDFSMQENLITSLFVDHSNTLWINSRNGVFKFNPETGFFKTLERYNDRLLDNITLHDKIVEDQKGNIWIANNIHGILKFSGISDHFEKVRIKGSPAVITLTFDRDGIFLFGTYNAGLLKFDPEKTSFSTFLNNPEDSNSISPNGVFGLMASKTNPGIIYIGTRGEGLNILDSKTQVIEKIRINSQHGIFGAWASIRGISESADGSLWLGTWGDGLVHLDQNRKEIQRYTFDHFLENNIKVNRIRVLKMDQENNLFVGTDLGLFKMNLKSGETKNILDHKSKTYPSEILKQLNSWLESDQKVASIEKVGNFQNLSQQLKIETEGNYLAVMVGEGLNESTLSDLGWIENANGDTLTHYSKSFNNSFYAGGNEKNRIYIEPLQLSSGNYTLKYVSDDSHSYNSWNEAQPTLTDLYGIALIKINNINQFEQIKTLLKSVQNQPAIGGSSIYDLEIFDNFLWVANNSGLDRINLSSGEILNFDHLIKDKNYPELTIWELFLDKNQNLWLCTEQGLIKINQKNNQGIRYTDQDGLPTNFIETILEGEDGNLWIATQSGISQMVNNESLGISTFINYYASDGLGGDSFISLAADKGSDGALYFGGAHGLTVISGSQKESKAPEILITDLLISNRSVFSMDTRSLLENPLFDTESITLSHDQNNLAFEYAAIHFADPQKNQYAHMLKGYDLDWNYDNRNFASYTNLEPGKYQFLIRASNAYGVWTEKPKGLEIIILPPWWQTSWAYLGYSFIFVLAIIAIDRQMRQRLLAKERERNREKELAHAKEIEKAYSELKSAQAQLIQSEKMASLGELTAGIAHEIQNPLNFVNNFSEVSAELVEEIQDSRLKTQDLRPKTEEDEIEDEILEDIRQNLEKIQHHGKRADAIVKGMLEHSRKSTGEKVPTDINALSEEYLRLSYHGMRAKDKSFDCNYQTDFDPNLPKVNIIPQDIGRVLLNIINNAFQACSQADLPSPDSYRGVSDDKKNLEGLHPLVTVSTKNLGDKIEISVKDNGPGIPDAIKDKIFQPFFTTKPTGQGTGLGLSLAYDIVKAHGGEIRVESISGEGTTFVIQLPIA